MRTKRAQLIAEAVTVCCPHCGEPQLNQDGSEMWTPEDFRNHSGKRECVACDGPMVVAADTKAQFPALAASPPSV